MGTGEDDDQRLAAFLGTVGVGEIRAGVVAEVTRSGVTVLMDGFSERPVGVIGPLDLSWRRGGPAADLLEAGQRISAEVIAVDLDQRQIRLSLAATENPQLWAFLKALRPGQRLSGVVAAVKRFGVFVDLDDGPDHPVFPGVGFITIPELSWEWLNSPSDAVHIGQRVTCEVLAFDTTNGEARLSLRATRPDPFQAFARTTQVGQVLHGSVTELVPFGAFVRVADGIQGLIHLRDLADPPVQTPEEAVQVGDEFPVVITEIDPARRRVALSPRRAGHEILKP